MRLSYLICTATLAVCLQTLADSPVVASANPQKSASTRDGKASNKATASAKAPVSAKNAKAAVNPLPKLDQSWHVGAGYVWRNLGRLNFHTNPVAQSYLLPSLASEMNRSGGRSYADGFVNPDASTATSGETWNWGYTNASQIHGSDLAFHGTAFAETSRFDANPGWTEDMAGGGPILSVSWDQAAFFPGVRVGAELSVSLIQTDAGRDLSTFRVDQQEFNITDHYTIDPLGFPGAPFTGNFAGPGPIIPFSAGRRDVAGLANAGNDVSYYDNVREQLDLTLTTVSLGPTASFERGKIKGTLGTGLALNIANWDADKTDTLYRDAGGSTTILKQWHSHNGGTKVLPGLYFQASLGYALTAHWSAQAFGRYDWSQSLEGEVGGSRFSLDMSGWSVGGGLLYRF